MKSILVALSFIFSIALVNAQGNSNVPPANKVQHTTPVLKVDQTASNKVNLDKAKDEQKTEPASASNGASSGMQDSKQCTKNGKNCTKGSCTHTGGKQSQ
jgi:hypothetical protein